MRGCMFLRLTLKLIWLWLKENGRGLLKVIAIAAVLGALFIYKTARQISPITGRYDVSGTVDRIVPTHVGWNGRPLTYNYAVRLEGGGVVYVVGPISLPRIVGQKVKLTRYERQNGRTTYEFVETLLPYRSKA